MKISKSIVFIMLWLMILGSCFEPPEFSNKPNIRVDDVTLSLGPVGGFDTLLLEVFFQDGDGDLGIRGDENDYPYQPYNYFVDEGGELIKTQDVTEFTPGMKLTRKRSFSKGITGMKEFKAPYDCENYLIDSLIVYGVPTLVDDSYEVFPIPDEGPSVYGVVDTFYVEKNPNHYNIDVQFWVKCNCPGGTTDCCPDRDGDGDPDLDEQGYYEYSFVDQPWPLCGETFYGRFPIVDRGDDTPMEGTIKYAMKSSGFNDFFGNKTFKLKVKIRDRAFNESNEVTTRGYTLAEITRRR